MTTVKAQHGGELTRERAEVGSPLSWFRRKRGIIIVMKVIEGGKVSIQVIKIKSYWGGEKVTMCKRGKPYVRGLLSFD